MCKIGGNTLKLCKTGGNTLKFCETEGSTRNPCQTGRHPGLPLRMEGRQLQHRPRLPAGLGAAEPPGTVGRVVGRVWGAPHPQPSGGAGHRRGQRRSPARSSSGLSWWSDPTAQRRHRRGCAFPGPPGLGRHRQPRAGSAAGAREDTRVAGDGGGG